MEAAVEAAAAGVVVAVAAAEGAAADEGTQGRPQRAPMTRRRKRKAGPFAAACWVRPGSRFVKRTIDFRERQPKTDSTKTQKEH